MKANFCVQYLQRPVNGGSEAVADARQCSPAPARDSGAVDGSSGTGRALRSSGSNAPGVTAVCLPYRSRVMWLRSLIVSATLVACLVPAARGRARNHLLDGDDPLGSPGELAWQAWLLMDGSSTSGGGGSDAEVGLARRITPKSVFIAPAFAPQSLPPCADGHKRDAAGRCVQVVHINRDAQLNFLLQRLNNLHARPAPGRVPLPLALPARQQDLGPLRVRLRVPLPTAAPAPVPAPSEQPPAVTTTPPPLASPAAVEDGGPDDSLGVSVIMADVSKRSSAEQGGNNSSDSGDSGGADGSTSEPSLIVWTIQNNTLPKTQDGDVVVDVDGSSSTVELPTTTEAATGYKDAPTTSATPSTELLAPLSDALDASEVDGAFPMLVISPGTSAPVVPTTTTTAPMSDVALGDAPYVNRTVEGSGEPPDGNASDSGKVTGQEEDSVGSSGVMSSTEHGNDTGSAMNVNEDDREAGSADVLEQIEVVPISENSRHNLPLVGDNDQDTSFSQADFASGLAGLFRPLPVDLPSLTPQDETPYGNPVRFPTDTSDEPQRFHLFKGNYLKFPIENAYRYKHRPVAEPPDAKQTFWWVPSGWRIDQQRHPPALQDFWPRVPPSEDSSPHFSQYNPSYHSPLPYQQRQAQYDPQWSSMKKQMTS